VFLGRRSAAGRICPRSNRQGAQLRFACDRVRRGRLNIPGAAESNDKETGYRGQKKRSSITRAKNLLETKEKLLGEIDSELRAERESNKDEGMDSYDLASEERDREINFILSDRERVKLKQIDDALERLDEGNYGVCESCGLEIAEERLTRDAVFEAVPRLANRIRSAKRNRSAASTTSATPIEKSARPTPTTRASERRASPTI